MEDNTRIIHIEDDDVKSLCNKKLELVKKGTKLNDRALKIAEKHADIVSEINGIADEIRNIQLEIIPKIKEICKKQDILSQYEVPLTTDIQDGNLILKVQDQLEAYRKKLDSIDKFAEVVSVKDAKEEIKE